MEKQFAPEIYELAEQELDKIKHNCEVEKTVEAKLLAALLDYYDMKKDNPAEASNLWGKVQHLLDGCPLKSC